MSQKALISVIILICLKISVLFAQVPTLSPLQTVNPATGEMTFALPLGQVQDASGNQFPIALGYGAGIQTAQSASPAGLGFDVLTGSISRKIVMIPDDATRVSAYSGSHCKEAPWKRWIKGILLSIEIAASIVALAFGQVEVAVIVTTIASQAASTTLQLFESIDSFYATPADYKAGGTHQPVFDYGANNLIHTGCFVGDGDNHDLPDIYFVNTPFFSGELVYAGKNADGSQNFKLKKESSSQSTKITYKDDGFEIVLPDGMRLYFDKSTKTRDKTNIQGKEKFDNGDRCDYSTEVSKDWASSQWYLTRVLYSNFNGTANDVNNNTGDAWAKIEYLDAGLSGTSFYTQTEQTQFDERSAGSVTTRYQSFTYPKCIRTATQRAEFNYTFDRLDNVAKNSWYDTYFLQPRLSDITFYNSNNQIVRKVSFTTDYLLRPGTVGAKDALATAYYIPDGIGGVTESTTPVTVNTQKATLTLLKVNFYSSNTTASPLVVTFNYDPNKNYELTRKTGTCLKGINSDKKTYIIEQRDLWGYFSDIASGANDFNIAGNAANVAKIDAWSLKSISFPTGLGIQWDYEPNRYDRANNAAVSSGSGNLKYGGGIRVCKLSALDGGKISKTWNYFYTDLSTPGHFAESPTNQTSGHATAEPYPYIMDTDNPDPRPEVARGGYYTATKVAYEKVAVVENYNAGATVNAPNGYTVFEYTSPVEYQNYGKFGQMDMSAARGMLKSKSVYNSANKLISQETHTYDIQIHKVHYQAMHSFELSTNTYDYWDYYRNDYSAEGWGVYTTVNPKTVQTMINGVTQKQEYSYAIQTTPDAVTESADLTYIEYENNGIDPLSYEFSYYPTNLLGDGSKQDLIIISKPSLDGDYTHECFDLSILQDVQFVANHRSSPAVHGKCLQYIDCGEPTAENYALQIEKVTAGDFDGNGQLDLYIKYLLTGVQKELKWANISIDGSGNIVVGNKNATFAAPANTTAACPGTTVKKDGGKWVFCATGEVIGDLDGQANQIIETNSDGKMRITTPVPAYWNYPAMKTDASKTQVPNTIVKYTMTGVFDPQYPDFIDSYVHSFQYYSTKLPGDAAKNDLVLIHRSEAAGGMASGWGYIMIALLQDLQPNGSGQLTPSAQSNLVTIVGGEDQYFDVKQINVADLNGDGHLDLYIKYNTNIEIKWSNLRIVSGNLVHDAGTFTPPSQSTPETYGNLSRSGDNFTFTIHDGYDLKTVNMLTPSCQSVSYYIPNGTAVPITTANWKRNVAAASATQWSQFDGKWLPSAVNAWKADKQAATPGAEPTTSVDFADYVFTAGATNPLWVTTGSIGKYSNIAKPIENIKHFSSDKLGYSTTIYGHKERLPLASIANARFKESGVFTGDYDLNQTGTGGGSYFDLENGWSKGATNEHSLPGAESKIDVAAKHFGEKGISVKNAFGPTRSFKLEKNRDYILSAWVKPVLVSGTSQAIPMVKGLVMDVNYRKSSDGGASWPLQVYPNSSGNPEIHSSGTIDPKLYGDWYHVKLPVPAQKDISDAQWNDGYQYAVVWVGCPNGNGVDQSAMVYVDDIRFYPKDAMVTSTYYDQKWYQPILSIDANNNPGNKVVYDDFGRVSEVYKVKKDDINNPIPIKKNEYHFYSELLEGDKVEILSPNGYEKFTLRQEITIKWVQLTKTNANITCKKEGSSSNYGVINQEFPAGQNEYKWQIPFDATGDYRIIITVSGETDQSDRTFQIGIDPTKWYKIVPAANENYCIEIKDENWENNNPVHLWTYKGTMNQQWQIVPDGAGCYNIVSKGGSTFKLGYTVDREVPKIKTDDTDNQKWKLHDTYDGYYRISAKADDLEFIDLNGGTASDGGIVQIWKSGTNSKWKFVEVTGGNETRIASGALDFYIEKTEVPQAEFEVIMNYNNSVSLDNLKPVTNVTMWDAILYCNARSKKEGLEPVYVYTGDPNCQNCTSLPDFVNDIDLSKNGYRLPTEEEWKAAYYYNTGYTYPSKLYFWGDGNTTNPSVVDQYAWYGQPYESAPLRITERLPNPAGLYHMAGNVCEWVWFTGAGISKSRIYGGGYNFNVAALTGGSYLESNRRDDGPSIGFRMVRTVR